jgi:glycosyltransferase involved in cell wall biosynthesis
MGEGLDNILVSVITITYNSSKFVRDAIESVLNQKHKNIQYIIGDDCSSDDTWKIINEFKDNRIVSYRNEKNIGEYKNRNLASSLAKGKYFMFIDGDDYLYPHAIGYFLENIENYNDCAFLVQKNYINKIIFPLMLYPHQTIEMYYFSENNLLSSSFASNFFKTELFLSIGGLSTIYKSGDEDIRIRLAALHPVLFVQGWVSWPRETIGQASSKISTIDRLIEQNDIFNNLVLNKLITNNTLIGSIKLKLSRSALRTAIILFIKLQWKEMFFVKKIIKQSGISYLNLFFKKQKITVDIFSSYTSMNPLNKQIGSEK